MNRKTLTVLLGTLLLLGVLLLGCNTNVGPDTGDDTGDDSGTPDTAELAPPTWIQGVWKYTDYTGYETYTFSADNVVHESHYTDTPNTTNYAETHTTAADSTTGDSVYSITAGYSKWEWTLQENGTLLFKNYYDGEESTSLTKYLIPETLVGIEGTIHIDDSYAESTLHVVVENSEETILDQTAITVEADTKLYDYELYADAAVTSFVLYLVVDPDGTFGNEDDMQFFQAESPLGEMTGGDSDVDNDFPLAKVSGQVTISDSTTDNRVAMIALFDSATPSGDPIGSDYSITNAGTSSYDWEILVNVDDFTEGEAYALAKLEDGEGNELESGAYGSNPITLMSGGNHQNIIITTAAE